MNSRFSDWQHALISTVILLIIAVSFFLLLIRPAITIEKKNAELIENLSFQLNKFSNAELQINALKSEIVSLKKNDINKSDFLQGDSPAIVAANLQKKLKSMIESSGGNLVSTHAITGNDEDIHSKVSIKVHMQVDMNSLQTVLFNLMTHKPLLFTDNLIIQSRNTSARRKNKNSGLLEVRFDVTGYLNLVAT
jgi:Type II secretion system (T2SS), protein M subtype b